MVCSQGLFHLQKYRLSLSNLVADAETDLLSYFQSDREWSPEIFYTVALQLLGFHYFIDFEDTDSFLKEVQFPIEYGTWLKTSITSSILEQSKGIY